MTAGNPGQEGDSSEPCALLADGESFAHSHALWFCDRKLPTALEALLREKSGVWWILNYNKRTISDDTLVVWGWRTMKLDGQGRRKVAMAMLR